MALVLADDGGDAVFSTSHKHSIIEIDETAFDLYRMLQSSRGTQLPCFDHHLPANALSPSHAVVLHGESGAGKSALLRNILASYVLDQDAGGHSLPAVFVDADHCFDASLLARLLKVKAECAGASRETVSEIVTESLSRVLVLRPHEPIDLLRQLRELRTVFASNPTAGLLIVDSMSAWQSLSAAFPRSAGCAIRECWQAVGRLQQESSISAVLAYRESAMDATGSMIHLGVGRCPKVHGVGDDLTKSEACATLERFSVFPWGKVPSTTSGPNQDQTFFALSPEGEVVTI